MEKTQMEIESIEFRKKLNQQYSKYKGHIAGEQEHPGELIDAQDIEERPDTRSLEKS